MMTIWAEDAVEWLLRRIPGLTISNHRALYLGCVDAGFGIALRSRFHHVSFADRETALDIEIGDFCGLPKYDLVVYHNMERLRDPTRLLRGVRSALNSRGLFFLCCATRRDRRALRDMTGFDLIDWTTGKVLAQRNEISDEVLYAVDTFRPT